MSLPCPDREQLTAYALGALASDQEGRLDAHLQRCGSCSAELVRLAPAIALLGESVEQLQPPPELRERLLEIVNREAKHHAGRRSASPPRRLFGFLLRPTMGLVAAGMLVAGAAGYLIHTDPGGPTRTVALQGTLAGAEGRLAIDDGVGTLTASGMPELPVGEIYQVWVRSGQVVAPAATFVPHQDGTATTAVELVPGGREVLVTREPGAGRSNPSGPTLLSASLD